MVSAIRLSECEGGRDEPGLRLPLWSKADISARIRHVRFALNSRHFQKLFRCPLSAKSGHPRLATERERPLNS
jgi:hypothetical protein